MSNTPRPDEGPALDWADKGICLGDAGHIGSVIEDDGTRSYFIISHDPGTWLTAPGDERSIPAHERTGPLPRSIAAAAASRCNAERSDGARCRARVPYTGARCQHHEQQRPGASRYDPMPQWRQPRLDDPAATTRRTSSDEHHSA